MNCYQTKIFLLNIVKKDNGNYNILKKQNLLYIKVIPSYSNSCKVIKWLVYPKKSYLYHTKTWIWIKIIWYQING